MESITRVQNLDDAVFFFSLWKIVGLIFFPRQIETTWVVYNIYIYIYIYIYHHHQVSVYIYKYTHIYIYIYIYIYNAPHGC